MIPTFFPLNKFALRIAAANGTTQLGSTIIFILSYTNRSAFMISFSETNNISETCSFIIPKVCSLNVVSNPSAMVSINGAFSTLPDCKLKTASAAPSGSPPYTFKPDLK